MKYRYKSYLNTALRIIERMSKGEIEEISKLSAKELLAEKKDIYNEQSISRDDYVESKFNKRDMIE